MLYATYACFAEELNNDWMDMECDMTDELTLRCEQPRSLASRRF
jgi:hypothetical protein